MSPTPGEATTMQLCRWRARLAAASAVTLCLLLAACGSDGAEGGRFDAGTAPYPLACLAHQSDKPGPAYTAEQGADTAAIFTMLKYYTANKAVTTYCDTKTPTETDRRWAQLYIDLGAEPANVAHILG